MNETTDTIAICGVIMPISPADDLHTKDHWEAVLDFISEAISRAGMKAQPVWLNGDFDVIQARILKNLFENEIVVCDVSTKNPNVMLELGMRLTTKRPTIIIAELGTKLPFDTSIINTEFYDPSLKYGDISIFIAKLAKILLETRASYLAGSYHTYLEHFEFETVRPNSVTISGEQAISNKLDKISLGFTKLEEKILSSLYSSFYSSKIDENSIGRFDILKTLSAADPANLVNPDVLVGSRVLHDKFGAGTVLEVDGSKAIIKFDNVGEKRVISSFLRIL